MAQKKRHDEPQTSSRNAMIVLIAGGLAVAGLLGWALTRQVDPQPAAIEATQPPLADAPAAPAATPATDTHDHQAEQNVPRTTVEQLRQQIAAGNVTLIDVRDANSYLSAHIPGSLHIPFSRIEGEIPYLPKTKPIVTYCT